METKGESWKKLIDGFLSFRTNETVSSAIPGLVTGNGKKNLEQVLEGLVREVEAPILTAWDLQENKAR